VDETSFRIDGKVAIVTGAASGGIGETYAAALASAGASVVCADIDGAGAEAAAKGIDGALGLTVDITAPDSVAAMVAATTEAFGGVDVLVNNAALMEQVAMLSLVDVPIDDWNRLLAVNVTGALVCSQAVVPSMRERGGGAIVNQSSGGAWASPGAYSLTKLAIVALTHALATELGPSGIRVNAIAPGMTDSAAGRRLIPVDSPFRDMLRAQAPLRPFGPPDDLVGPLLLLCSEAGSWMTGQTLNVDGGWVMRT
jgi:NAD(P)-dependent dehydrogenase (short-subunit alcohol dehydrogenase family)